MPRGYRRYLIAVVGCLTLGNVNQAAEQGGRSQHSRAGRQQTTPAQQPAPDRYKPACNQPKDGNEAGVCASLRQAQAAEQANAISTDGLWWNKLGIAAVVATLFATAWAAYEASVAARAARRATDIFVQGDRATLSPFSGGLVPQYGGRTVPVLSVANVGKSAAVVTHVAYAWGASGNAKDYAELPAGAPRAELCPAGETVTLGLLTGRDYDQPFVVGYAEYRDPYASNHRSYFTFEVLGGSAGSRHVERTGVGWPADS